MTDILIEPPTQLAVPIETARQALGIVGDHMDATIELQLRGITDIKETELEQKIMAQTWLTTEPGVPWRVRLPHPVRRIVSVKITDAAGTETDVPAADYYVTRSNSESWLSLRNGGLYGGDRYAGRVLYSPNSPVLEGALVDPAGAAIEGASIAITSVAGMAEAPAQVPPKVQFYLLAKLREHFDAEKGDVKKNEFLDNSLQSMRIY